MMFAANISPIRNKYINFKFDTGATRTVISVNALMDKEYTLEEQKEQFHQIKNAKDALVIDEFTSASGDKMGGIKCCASQINLSGEIWENFYYYIVFGSKRKTALIGDDFISCCSFVHSVNGDIILKSFDDGLYTRKNGSKSIKSVELIDFLLHL